jgi:hypothetical protein
MDYLLVGTHIFDMQKGKVKGKVVPIEQHAMKAY